MAGNLPSNTADTNLGCAGTIAGDEATGQNFETGGPTTGTGFDTRAILFDGTYEYWGGDFTKFGSTGNASQYVLNSPTTRNRILAIVDSTKALSSWNPNANAEVFCIVAGPAGKLYVAGNFTTINGVSRSRVALIGDASGSPTVDTTFVPGTINGRITGLAYDSATAKVYISGQFTSVGGTGRAGVACLDGADASLQAWNPGIAGGNADCRRIILGRHATDTGFVYLCGEWTSCNGSTRAGLCAVVKTAATASPAVQTWAPDLTGTTASLLPHDVAISPDGTRLVVANAGSDVGADGNKGVCYQLVNSSGSLARVNTRLWEVAAAGDGGDHNACAIDNQYAAFGHHGDGSQSGSPGTNSKANHKIYLVNIADGSSTTWIPNPEPNSIQGTYSIRLYDDRLLVGHVWTRPTQGMSRYPRAGTGGGGGGTGGGSGWAQVYESRMPLGGAAKTNYGPGQQGRTLYHQTQQAPGTSTAISAPTWGYGKYGAITLALTTSGGGGDTTPPTVPTSLVATATGSTTAHLAWNPSTDANGVAGYTIYRGGASVTTVVGTTFNDTGLNPGQTYSYTVDAFDAAGNHSAQSSASSITTTTVVDTTPPTIPGGLTATVTGSHITLSWTASTDANGVAGYNIIRSGVKIAVQTGTVYVDVSGTPGTSYTYAVSAFDAVPNTSGLSNTQTITYPVVVAGVTIRQRISESSNTASQMGPLILPGTQVGDFIIATVRVAAQNLTITAPTGWTSIQLLNPGSSITQQSYYRIYQNGDDSNTWVWTWSGQHPAQMSMINLIGAAALDNVGRTSVTTYPLQIASVTLSGPSDFLYFTGSSISPITGSVGNGLTTLEAGGQAEPPGLEILSAYISPAPSGTNGPYTTTVSATNNRFVGSLIGITAGNPIIVNTGPSLSVTAPANGVTVNATTVNFQAVTNDPDGIASIIVNTLSGPVSMTPLSVDASGNGTYAATITLLTSASPGSQNDFTVTSTDSNVSPLSTTSPTVSVFGVQNTADTSPPTLAWDTPASGTDASVQGADGFDYGISFSASDPSGLGEFTIDTPDGLTSAIAPSVSNTFFYHYTLATGANVFTLHTLDGIGNAGTVTFTITLVAPDVTDVTGPTVVLATPAGATTTVVGPNGTVYTVNGTANDPSGIASVTVNGINQAIFVDDQTSIFNAPIALTTGSNTLTVVATDASVGANTTTVTRTLVLENTAGPLITVITPASTSITIQGDTPYLYEVTGTVTSGNGLTLFTVDSVPVTVATDGSWAQIISLDSGMNDVVFEAVDSLNNQTLLTYEITLEPLAPGAEGAFDLSTDQERMAQRLQNRGTE